MNKSFTTLVLSKSLSGESGLLYKLLSPEDGLLTVYKRASAKKTSQLPDFFDEISADASKAKNGDMLFLNEFEIQKRRTGIARNYDSFCVASDITKLLLHNSRYLEHFDSVYAALSGALDALDAGACADAVKIKFLYVFVRDEGYPVKESFARSLNDEDYALLVKILKTPSLECRIEENESARLLMHLERWMYSSTDVEEA